VDMTSAGSDGLSRRSSDMNLEQEDRRMDGNDGARQFDALEGSSVDAGESSRDQMSTASSSKSRSSMQNDGSAMTSRSLLTAENLAKLEGAMEQSPGEESSPTSIDQSKPSSVSVEEVDSTTNQKSDTLDSYESLEEKLLSVDSKSRSPPGGEAKTSEKQRERSASSPPNMVSSLTTAASTGAGAGITSTASTSPSIAMSGRKSASLRRGKWTAEEEEYVARVIQDFNFGYLDAPAGTTLRTFLSEKLQCDPMRITKKFTGDACIGKRVFHPAVRSPSNSQAITKAQVCVCVIASGV
jgi:hypothetical protein